MSRDGASLLDMLKAARLAVEFREDMSKRGSSMTPRHKQQSSTSYLFSARQPNAYRQSSVNSIPQSLGE
jgi:hypothetical protein